jgi:hypothetical protein
MFFSVSISGFLVPGISYFSAAWKIHKFLPQCTADPVPVMMKKLT